MLVWISRNLEQRPPEDRFDARAPQAPRPRGRRHRALPVKVDFAIARFELLGWPDDAWRGDGTAA